jgi:hypothetical protein
MLNGSTDGSRNERSLSTALKVGRLSVVAISVVLLAVASLVPILYGALRNRPSVEAVVSAPPCVCTPANSTCPDYSIEIRYLQQLLKSSQEEVANLSQTVYTLQSQLLPLEEAPSCSIDTTIEQSTLELRQKHQYLLGQYEELQNHLSTTVQQSKYQIQELQEQRESQYRNVTETVETAYAGLAEIYNQFATRVNETELLHVISSISMKISESLQTVDADRARFHSLRDEVDLLYSATQNFSCPEPIIPAIVIPEVKVNCPKLPNPVVCTPTVASPSHIVSNGDEQPDVPVRECVDMSAAQEIVSNMVLTELDLLAQNLTRHCDSSLQATMGAFLGATESAGRTTLEEFLRQSESHLNEHAEFVEDSIAHAREAAQADREQGRRERQRDAHTHRLPASGMATALPAVEPEEADYALLSSGARVIPAQTSRTYYPAEWTVPAQVKGALGHLGLSADVADASAGVVDTALDYLGSADGKQLYQGLNLHKSIGMPEDALRTDLRVGSCWPMEVYPVCDCLPCGMC